MSIARRTRVSPALALALLSLLTAGTVAAPPARAGAPAAVTVSVLGPGRNYEALTPLTKVTTTTTLVTKDEGSCPGTSAAGALELATKGNWSAKFYGSELGYFIETIDGQTFTGPEYWEFWVNNMRPERGICGVEMQPGDHALFFPECYSETKGECEPEVLGIEAPATAEVGRQVTVTVSRYNAKGEHSPAAGINVGGGGTSAETNAEGRAQLIFSGDGTYTLRATGGAGEEPKSVPGEAFICAHEGNDGTCGTTGPGNTPLTQTPASGSQQSVPYTGPYALVADATGVRDSHHYARKDAPRVLSGKVVAHAVVTSISLRLRRTYRGHCWAYEGSRERFVKVRCRQGSFFRIASGGGSFSYLLPSRLPPGRYVLDVQATDANGNHTALARGSSRIVFYVK
jgi:hypothetical protein